MSGMMKHITDGNKGACPPESKPAEIGFFPSLCRISMMKELKRALEVKLPQTNLLETEETKFLMKSDITKEVYSV